jgi:hypothetical protein
MTVRERWSLAAAVGVPFMVMTAYLLWVWPWTLGDSLLAESVPYMVSLLAGLPFAWGATHRSRRWWLLLLALIGSLIVLWFYALAVLCGVRGVCL